MSNKTITILEDEEKTRLDSLIAKRFSETSRSYIQYLFKEKMIKVNDKDAKKKDFCKAGDEISITFKNLPDIKLASENIPLEILFEDKDIIVCNKPAGMVTHPAPGSYRNTFAGALLFYLKSLPSSDDPLRPGIVHRLDKETSGIIIAAKTARSLQALQVMFAERKVKKTYLAVCHGYLSTRTINAPLARNPRYRKQICICSTGKEALTEFELLDRNKGFSLVKALPFTGRTHQIRVHARYAKNPIVGDSTYGPKKALGYRHLLHAYQISFLHPFTNEQIDLTAPLPEDFKTFLNSVTIPFDKVV